MNNAHYKLVLSSVILVLLWFLWTQGFLFSSIPMVSKLADFLVVVFTVFLSIGISKFLIEAYVSEKRNTSQLFLIASLVALIYSGLVGVFSPHSAIDLQLHDTYFVIAHFHVILLFVLLFGFYALVYSLLPKILRMNWNEVLGRIHFWITILGLLFMAMLMYLFGNERHIRSYYNFDGSDFYKNFDLIIVVISVVLILLVLAQCIFLFNAFHSILKKVGKSE